MATCGLAYLVKHREASADERAITARSKVIALPRVAPQDDHQRARDATRKLGWDPE